MIAASQVIPVDDGESVRPDSQLAVHGQWLSAVECAGQGNFDHVVRSDSQAAEDECNLVAWGSCN
jgi:hypothetical protein